MKLNQCLWVYVAVLTVSACGAGDLDSSGSSSSASSSSSSSSASSSSSSGRSSTEAIVPLYDQSTPLESAVVYDRGDALVTHIADRGRDRHAKESQFQAYDHYLSFYWKHRTATIEIVDYVAKGGDTIRMNVTTQWRLNETEAENRWFYRGVGTVAEYFDNGTMKAVDELNYYKE